MKRFSSPILTNLSEGCGRNSNQQLKYFFNISAASASGLQYQLILSKDLGYISISDFQERDD